MILSAQHLRRQKVLTPPMSQDVELDGVTMRFGEMTAVRDVNLVVRAGRVLQLPRPLGLRQDDHPAHPVGLHRTDRRRRADRRRDMAGIGPNGRPTALIFQNLALFPLMSVWENIAFGLEVRGVSRAQRRKRAEELLDLIALPDAADKRIDELSGGMKQRVAIARALAVEPQVMLLDEPLSALDLKLRQHMRAELRAIQKKTGVTFIYITHDQGEAFTMSDRVAVMSRGRAGAGRAAHGDLRRSRDAVRGHLRRREQRLCRPRDRSRRRRGDRGDGSRPAAGPRGRRHRRGDTVHPVRAPGTATSRRWRGGGQPALRARHARRLRRQLRQRLRQGRAGRAAPSATRP